MWVKMETFTPSILLFAIHFCLTHSSLVALAAIKRLILLILMRRFCNVSCCYINTRTKLRVTSSALKDSLVTLPLICQHFASDGTGKE